MPSIYSAESISHEAQVSPTGRVSVRAKSPKTIQEFCITDDGIQVIEHTQESNESNYKHILKLMEELPLLEVWYNTEGMFHVDLDVGEGGIKRWTGDKTEDEVTEALRRCNFAHSEIEMMITICKSHPQKM